MSDEIQVENTDEVEDQIGEDTAVTVYPGTDREKHGIVVADFGEMTGGHGVELGGLHFADPARRYAVSLDTGELIFVDQESLAVASPTA